MNMNAATIMVALLVFLNVAKMSLEAVLAHHLPMTRGVRQLGLMSKLWLPLIPLFGVFTGLLVGWVLGYTPTTTGLGVLGFVMLSRWSAQRPWAKGTVKNLGLYSPGPAVFLVLWSVQSLREFGMVIPEQTEWHIAAGVLSYAWTTCGIRKLQQSGWKWAASPNIGLLLAERMYIGTAYRRFLGRWVLARPRMLLVVGIFGLGFELLGVIYCVPDLRMGYASAVLVFMLINYVLFGFFELEWGLIGVAVALGTVG